jgi:peptide/nickel transport system substrate-binding protein
MLRKVLIGLMVISICVLISLPVFADLKNYSTLAEYEKITGKTITEFHEAPMLKEKVIVGELPTVVERLPEEPMVVEPAEEIGKYGGTLRGPATQPVHGGWDVVEMRAQFLLRVAPDYKTIAPNIAKGWDFSKDFKNLTIYLRKGMKWSDGSPLTADDFLFWYEDILCNKEITPAISNEFKPGGELMKVKKVDDYTVRFTFAVPYPSILTKFASGFGYKCFYPKHYLQKYHIKYNPKADELAKEEGYSSWPLMFGAHGIIQGIWELATMPIDCPTVMPFMGEKVDSFGNRYYVRNPYYWKVDTEGNQLPYIDKSVRILVEDNEVQNLKGIAGEYTNFGWGGLTSLPMYRENAEKGDYHIVLMEYARGNEQVFFFNLTHKDLVLRKIFNDIRFRQAMSLAINREEINQLVYFGQATPRQGTVHPSVSFYEPWMGKYMAEYDPERANKLLDEVGLIDTGGDGYRELPDGKSLVLDLHVAPAEPAWEKINELVSNYWGEVGIKINYKIIDRSYNLERLKAGDFSVNSWAIDNTNDFSFYATGLNNFDDWDGEGSYKPIAILWDNWFDTNGEKGIEPPEVVKDIHNKVNKIKMTSYGSEEYEKLGKEIITEYVKNLFIIGTVGMPMQPVLIKNSLKNTPKEGLWDWGYRQWQIFQPDQFFFDE